MSQEQPQADDIKDQSANYPPSRSSSELFQVVLPPSLIAKGKYEAVMNDQVPDQHVVGNDSSYQSPSRHNTIKSPFKTPETQLRSSPSDETSLSKIRRLSKLEQNNEPSLIEEKEQNNLKVEPKVDSVGVVISPKHEQRGSILSQNRLTEADSEVIDIFKANDEDEKSGKIKKGIRRLMKRRSYRGMMAMITVYALFADNIRWLFFNQYSDGYFSVLSAIVMGFFVLEILMKLWVKPTYKKSFFFWLDIASTVSLVFDITYICMRVVPASAIQTAQLIRTFRTTTIGSRAGRVLRTIYFMRIARAFKIHKNNQQHFEQTLQINAKPNKRQSLKFDFNSEREPFQYKEQTTRPSISAIPSPPSIKEVKDHIQRRSLTAVNPFNDELELKETRVGRKLSNQTAKRLTFFILAILIFFPMFEADFYFDDNFMSPKYEISLLQTMLNTTNISQLARSTAIKSFIEQGKRQPDPLVYLSIGNKTHYIDNRVDFDALRNNVERRTYEEPSARGMIVAIISIREIVFLKEMLDLMFTVFLCLILTFGSLLISKDANDLVLRPIERMVKKVNAIAKNPLLAKEHTLVKDCSAGFKNETIQVENAITKIGGLLALGFGEAGSAIVANNIAQTGDINPMMPGKKKMAIFGFCDIRNFTDATEVLQEDVMVFVNSIAGVVHSMVDRYTGAANKNIGDAFLLVWKIPENNVYVQDNGSFELDDNLLMRNMADFSLISFLKINARINRDPSLVKYSENEGLKARLPNYKVRMGFGLHIGWAIEGAIGSESKIDASYLSPNVNMASRLEAATKQYGVPLLFSGDLYKYLSPELKDISRLIDIVTVKGSTKPVEVYTVDMDVEDFQVAKDKNEMTAEERALKHKTKKEVMQYVLNSGKASAILESDKDLKHMFRNKNQEFERVFREGFNAYIAGNWQTAKEKFTNCLEIKQEDGPTQNLMSFLGQHEFIAPAEWKGCRVLTEK